MRHVVFVETNSNGLNAFQVAKDAGHYVTFIKSGQYDHFYTQSAKYDDAITAIDNYVEIDDVMDIHCLSAALTNINRMKPIDAVLTVLEHVVLPLAHAAEMANIRYLPLESVRAARDKSLLRRELSNKGIRSCAFVAGDDPDSLITEAENKVGYPAIVKPASGFSSLLVKRFNNRDELQASISEYRMEYQKLKSIYKRSIDGTLLIEEFLSGRMISLEIGAINGKFIPIAIADRKQYSQDESIELGGTMPIDIQEPIKKEIYRYGIELLRSLGFSFGIFHIEMILTNKGPVVFDLNPRIAGGSGGGQMLSMVIGHSIYQSMIDFFLGDEAAVSARRYEPQCYATDRELVCMEEAIYRGANDFSWMEDYRGKGLTDFIFCLQPGDKVAKVGSNNDVIGTVVVKAETEASSKALADEIVDRLRDTLNLPLILR